MFGNLGRKLFSNMIAIAGSDTVKTVQIRFIDVETYDTATGTVSRTPTTANVTGFWGKVAESELKRDGIRATDIKFSFPAYKVTRPVNVDDEGTLAGTLYKVVDVWTDAAGVQMVVCFRVA